MRTQLEKSTRTKTSENVHFRREPFQSTMTTTETPQAEDWIDQRTVQPRRPQIPSHLPALKLAPFEREYTKFLEGFKTLIHDQVRSDYQRMVYLTPRIRSSIAGLVTKPRQYREALQALKKRYGHPTLLIKAVTQLISNLPGVRSRYSQSLESFIRGLEEAIAN